MVARELGMSLGDYLGWPGPVTHRQHQAWVDWLRGEGEPSNAEYQTMALRRDVRGIFSESVGNLDEYRIKWRKPLTKKEQEEEDERDAERATSIRMAELGVTEEDEGDGGMTASP